MNNSNPKDIASATGWQVYKRLLGYVKQYKLIIGIGILANIAYALVETNFVNAIQYLIDDGINKKDEYFLLIQTPLFIVGTIFVRGIFNFIAVYCVGWTGRKIVQTLREELYEHYLKQPAQFFSENTPGSLLSSLTFNIEQVAQASSNAITTALRSGGMVVFALMYMLILNWRLTIFILIITPVVAWVVSVSSKRLKKVSKNIQNSIGEVTHKTEQSIKAHQVIKMFGGHELEVERFKQAANRNRQQEMKLIATQGLASPTIQTIAGIGFAAIVYFGAKQILADNMSAGDFVTYIGFMALILKPLKDLTNVNTLLQKGIAGAQSVFELLDLDTEIDSGKFSVERVKGAIRFNHVDFSYANSEGNILQDISFEAKPGQTIALVGRSGSGKSTITSLLPRLYNIEQGELSIDGIPVNDYQLDSLRKQISIVSQNVVLFNDTIKNNIAYGSLGEASKEAIIEAAKNAYAWEFIEQFPEQLESLVGDNGAFLSGGQRQRVAIARAMLKDAPILILDEATSALDTESERHIQKALERLMSNRTTIVVAHRLSTIEKADKILVINEGQIVESGTHKELLDKNGEYTRLHQMQFSDE